MPRNDQYAITLIIYRIAGVQLDPSFDVDLQSPCDTFQVQVNTPSGVELSHRVRPAVAEQHLQRWHAARHPAVHTYSTVVTLPPCSAGRSVGP